MTTTLASLTTRVQAALMDTGAAVWDAGTVTEGIRLAVGEYSLAGKAAVMVSGLDGAGATTLSALHDSLIVWGAAGYAAQSRSIDRVESFELGSEGTDLKAWGDARLKEFRAMLSFVFPGYLVVSSTTSSSSEDPTKVAAEVALMGAQADLVGSQAAAIDGKLTNENALISAQADLATSQAAAIDAKYAVEAALLTAQAAAVTGQEGRDARAAEIIAAEKAAEAARLAGLRSDAAGKPAGAWADDVDVDYPEDYSRT